MRTQKRLLDPNLKIFLGGMLGVLAMALVAVAGGPTPALAHASLESSSPARGEVVAEMPETIELVFSQDVARSGGLPEVIVVNASGDQVDLGATLSDDDRRLITVAMPPAMPDGVYTVIWHTLSDEDGEEARGAFDFYVGAEPTAEPETPAPGETDEPTEVPATAEPETGAPTDAPPTEPPADNGGDEDGGSDGVPLWALLGGIAAGAAVGFAGGIVAGGRKSKEEV